MAEYIERDELLFNFREIMPEEGENPLADEMYNIAFQMTDYDVAPVKHGKWIKGGNEQSTHLWALCSQCDESYDIADTATSDLTEEKLIKLFTEFYRYCPNCGAKMDGET